MKQAVKNTVHLMGLLHGITSIFTLSDRNMGDRDPNDDWFDHVVRFEHSSWQYCERECRHNRADYYRRMHVLRSPQRASIISPSAPISRGMERLNFILKEKLIMI